MKHILTAISVAGAEESCSMARVKLISDSGSSVNHARDLSRPGRVFPALPTMDVLMPPEDAAGHLAANQGRYVLMLETLVNAAAERGDIQAAMAGTMFLTKLTELGRMKIDQKIEVRQLRDEFDLSHLKTDEIRQMLKRREADVVAPD